MNNDTISYNFSLLAKLMDIHGENPFKSKSYANAAFQLDKLTVPLASLSPHQINGLKGIGETIGTKIVEQIETGELKLLNEYLTKTPPGILDMLRIKGIGPKKIATIWKELEIESLGELLYACNENRLTLYKGFGEKTQQNIKESIEFFMQHQGLFLYAQLETWVVLFEQQWQKQFPHLPTQLVGEFRRQQEIIHQLDWVTTVQADQIATWLTTLNFTLKNIDNPNHIQAISADGITIYFHCTQAEHFYQTVFLNSASEIFLQFWQDNFGNVMDIACKDELSIFAAAGIHPIPAPQRETIAIIELAREKVLPPVIQTNQIKGIIHSHSNWSDGSNTLEEMATAAHENGFEYLVISDHSRAAFYANGLHPDRILAQHREIERLNKLLAPFVIFKSIESDILNDGSLDYPNEVLTSFDLVIASIHSNLKMPLEKAMSRLISAIENPYTSILGHLTGRLLLSRSGYPVDHEKIIDACVANQVVIELNAHPRRLDIDWRWIEKAINKGALISINPDAHSIEGFADTRYGVLVAQKAGLPVEKNLSSFSVAEMKNFLLIQQQKR
ncbi:MAG: helix-hairpin-helix domain-containing protein [Chitinophagia bacterium]